MKEVLEKLEIIEARLDALAHQRMVQESYSTAAVAEILGKSEFTVREWCRLGRINAQKRECGRGKAGEWQISNDELERIKAHGLLSREPTE